MHNKVTSICFFLLLIFVSHFSKAQNGLEAVIVERYYVADAMDSAGSIGFGDTLRVGSVTYRVFVDMLPGYKFQVLYGVNTPGAEHELRLSTSTFFYNNTDRGSTTPSYTKTQARNNTVMLDSWFSAGLASTGQFGVLKTDDDGVATVINADGLLQNTDPYAGIPVKVQDGMVAGTYSPAVTFVGLTTELDVFDGTPGNLFSTWNASVANLNGTKGLDTTTNRVLIGQFTTDGTFCMNLNIQIGTPSGGTENYVAQNPVGNEIQMGDLFYCSDVAVREYKNSMTSFKVYPNPANEYVRLEIAPSKKSISTAYSIYSIYGSLILHKELGQVSEKYSERIDVSSLAEGMYVLEVISDGIRSAKQFIKQ